jgi:hypothetical protein
MDVAKETKCEITININMSIANESRTSAWFRMMKGLHGERDRGYNMLLNIYVFFFHAK